MFCTEFKLAVDDWPSLVPLVQSAINSSPSSVLGGLSPAQVFMGRKHKHALDSVFSKQLLKLSDVRVTPRKLRKLTRGLLRALATSHDHVAATPGRRGRKQESRPGVREVDFSVGDWVLVALPAGRSRSKLMACWKGPYLVLQEVNPLVFRVEHPVTKAVSVVHACRIKRYADSELSLTEPMLELAARTPLGHWNVDHLKEVRVAEDPDDAFEFLVAWEGLTDEHDSWHQIRTILEDVPDLVRSFVEALDVEEYPFKPDLELRLRGV